MAQYNNLDAYLKEKDLSILHTVQEALLPKEVDLQRIYKDYRIDIASYSETPAKISGDFWCVEELGQDKLALTLADCSGRGLQTAHHTLLLRKVMQACKEQAEDPALYLAQISQMILPLIPIESFATMFYGIVDTKEHLMHYATAGTTNALKVTGKGDMAYMPGKGFPIGAINGAEYQHKTMPCYPGDQLFFYSDALIETEGKQGELLDEEGIETLINANEVQQANAASILEKWVALFKKNHPIIQDDLTLVLCRFL